MTDYYEIAMTKWVSALTHMNLIICVFLVFPNWEFMAVSSFKYHISEVLADFNAAGIVARYFSSVP